MVRIWLDVEDLFQYAAAHPRPSGIQRVEYELCRALAEHPRGRERIRFVRHDGAHNSFYPVPCEQFLAMYEGLISRPAEAAERGPPRTAAAPHGALFQAGKKLAYRLSPALRMPLTQAYVHQRASLSAGADLLRAALGRAPSYRTPVSAAAAMAPPPPGAAEAFAREAAPGDVLAALGSPWFHPDYAGVIAGVQRDHGMRFALLVYDLIPLRRPEWCDRPLTLLFNDCVAKMLPLADILLSISRASAADVLRYAGDAGLHLRAPPQPIPMGTGFSVAAAPAVPRSKRLPPPGGYALIVSTIEARKNHALLFRVWRRLLEELPPDQVPTLVFAGRIGWLVADLMQQLRNADFLDGKIELLSDPTDAELAQLYEGCLFTLFPSFHEGWGLPVTESLAFGRPCIASGTTSLPEAGGALARYFDPDSASDALRVIREVIMDRPALDRWQRQIVETFRPVPWSEAAQAVLDAVA